jgi:hypothetical protein
MTPGANQAPGAYWNCAGVVSAHKEVTWHINKVVAVDTAQGHGRCTRRFAQTVRKNAKSLLNPEMTVRYTARIAIQNARAKAVKRRDFVSFLDIVVYFVFPSPD